MPGHSESQSRSGAVPTRAAEALPSYLNEAYIGAVWGSPIQVMMSRALRPEGAISPLTLLHTAA